MISIFSKVRVVGGKFAERLKGKIGEVDNVLKTGAVSVTFKDGHGDDMKQESYLLSPNSLQLM